MFFVDYVTSHLSHFRKSWGLWQTGQALRLFHWTKAACLFCCGLSSPWQTLLLSYRAPEPHWALNTDVACLSERLSQHNSCSAKRLRPEAPNPHPSSPQVFSNSTPLDVWEARLVVDHKALNHCLLIKHSTQWMRTGSPSPQCRQWLQMRQSSLCWSISLQTDIMALCLLERMATLLDTISQVSFHVS